MIFDKIEVVYNLASENISSDDPAENTTEINDENSSENTTTDYEGTTISPINQILQTKNIPSEKYVLGINTGLKDYIFEAVRSDIEEKAFKLLRKSKFQKCRFHDPKNHV